MTRKIGSVLFAWLSAWNNGKSLSVSSPTAADPRNDPEDSREYQNGHIRFGHIGYVGDEHASGVVSKPCGENKLSLVIETTRQPVSISSIGNEAK
jgi:hypothetical protein